MLDDSTSSSDEDDDEGTKSENQGPKIRTITVHNLHRWISCPDINRMRREYYQKSAKYLQDILNRKPSVVDEHSVFHSDLPVTFAWNLWFNNYSKLDEESETVPREGPESEEDSHWGQQSEVQTPTVQSIVSLPDYAKGAWLRNDTLYSAVNNNTEDGESSYTTRVSDQQQLSKMNFYIHNQNQDKCLLKDEFSHVRKYVCNEQYTFHNTTKPCMYLCQPSIIDVFMQHVLNVYEKNHHPINPEINTERKIYAKNLLMSITNYNHARRDIWDAVSQVVNKISGCPINSIIAAILEIVCEEKYLQEVIPYDYTKLIFFIIAMDSRKNLIRRLCQTITSKLLNEKLDIKDIMLITKFYAMICVLQRNDGDLFRLIYDALCRLRYRGHPMILGVLLVWPYVLPPSIWYNDLLTYVIAFSILNHDMKTGKKIFQVQALRNMIQTKYKYSHGRKTPENVLELLLENFQINTWEPAVLLLCKRQGALWTYTFAIKKYLLPIVNLWKRERCVPEWVFIKCLNILGSLFVAIRTPLKEHMSLENLAQLYADILFNQNNISYEIEEAVVTQLWSLSVVNFGLFFSIILKWSKMNKPVSAKLFDSVGAVPFSSIDMFYKTSWIFRLKALMPKRGKYKKKRGKKRQQFRSKRMNFLAKKRKFLADVSRR